ncbi:MAG: hypothetical protein ACRC5C_14970 [Bacilli bacterium]
MNKKWLITAGICMIVGVIGVVPSVLNTLPYVEGIAKEAEKELVAYDKNNEVASLAKPVKNIVIEASRQEIIFTKSKDNALHVYHQKDMFVETEFSTKYDAVNSVYSIQELGSTSRIEMDDFSSIPKVFEQFVKTIVWDNAQNAKLVVALPNAVDIHVIGGWGNVVINDMEVIGEKMTINREGRLIVNDFTDYNADKNKRSLVMNSAGHLYLDKRSLSPFTDVLVKAQYVEYNASYADSQSHIPSVLTLNANSVHVQSPYPLAKETNMQLGNGYESTIAMNYEGVEADIQTVNPGYIQIQATNQQAMETVTGNRYKNRLAGDKTLYRLSIASNGSNISLLPYQ